MQCPKCKSENPEGAEYCTLCFHFFKEKRVADFKRPLVRAATSELHGWNFHGPIVVDPDGIYFFIKESRYEASWTAQLAARLFGKAGGMAAGIAADKTLEAVAGAHARPACLTYDHRSNVDWLYGENLAEAPELVECSEYFAILRKDVVRMTLHAADLLVIETKTFALEIDGDFGEERTRAQLVLWRYPLGSKRPTARRFASVALLAAAAFGVWDFVESQGTVDTVLLGLGLWLQSRYWFILWYGLVPFCCAVVIYFLIKHFAETHYNP